MNAAIFFIAAALILFFWALGAYNRLVGLRASVLHNQQILIQAWIAQAHMVDARLTPYGCGDGANSAWMEVDEETQRWRALALSARQFIRCCETLKSTSPLLPSPDDVASVRAARHLFESNWQNLRNAHADLAGSAVPEDLQSQWTMHEMLLKDRLQAFIVASDQYHHAIGQFPANLLAGIFRFEKTGSLS